MSRARLGLVLGSALALAAGAAAACGVCTEDKVAATYDFAVVKAASARGQVVVFVEPKSSADAGVVARRLAAAASHVRGIEAATMRTSLSPAAVSFALDARTPPAHAVAALAAAAKVPGLQLVVLRVVH